MAKLLIQESAGIREFELVDEEVRMGRELDNTLRLSDPSISRHHAVLRRTATGYEVQDLGSSNGVLVNGARVQSSPLNDSDRVTLGQLHMTYVDPRPATESFSPLGTVRIDPSEMAKMYTPKTPEATAVATPVVAVPPPPPAAVPPAVPAPEVQDSLATAKAPAREPIAPVAPFTTNADIENPAPGFLQAWLPPIPDDAQPVMDGDVPERGDFVTRLLAHLIDAAPFLVLGALQFVANMLISLLPASLGCGASLVMGLVGLVVAILSLAYFFVFLPWCWTKFGASPGKKMMKLRVVPEDDPQGRIEFGTALMRIVGHIINGVICSLPYLMILGAERKGLQDILSKSLVIKVDR